MPSCAKTRGAAVHLERVAGLESQWTPPSGPRPCSRCGSEGRGACAPGPLRTAGVRFANLAAGLTPPSFVGRGGMGRALAEHGLVRLVGPEPKSCPTPTDAGWVRALQASPRLLARAARANGLQEAPAASQRATQTQATPWVPRMSDPLRVRVCHAKRSAHRARDSVRSNRLLALVSDRAETPRPTNSSPPATNSASTRAKRGWGWPLWRRLAWYRLAWNPRIDRKRQATLAPGKRRSAAKPNGSSGCDGFVLSGGSTRGIPHAGSPPLRAAGLLSHGADRGPGGSGAPTPKTLAERLALVTLGQRGAEPLRSYHFLLGDRADPAAGASFGGPHAPCRREASTPN